MMKNWLVGLVLTMIVVACGGNVDPRTLDGGWQLSRKDQGIEMRASQLYFSNGRVTPRGDGINACSMQYQINGDVLTIHPEAASACNMSGINLNIDSVSDNELILSLNGRRMYYYRIANRQY